MGNEENIRHIALELSLRTPNVKNASQAVQAAEMYRQFMSNEQPTPAAEEGEGAEA